MIASRHLFLLPLLFVIGAVAADEEDGDDRGWGGEGEVGFIATSGNTETTALNARITVNFTTGQWRHEFSVAGNSASDDERTSAERYVFTGKSDYVLSEKDYLFGTGRYEDDRFSSFEYQGSAAGGFGRKFVNNDATKFSAEAGFGYRRAKRSETRDTENEAIFRGALDFFRKLTDTTELTNSMLVESGSSNTFVRNELAVSLKVNDRISVKAAYELRYNTDPDTDTGSTDRLTIFNLVFGL